MADSHLLFLLRQHDHKLLAFVGLGINLLLNAINKLARNVIVTRKRRGQLSKNEKIRV